MAQRIEHFTATVPAGTTFPGMPFAFLFNEGTVTDIDIRIPDGHAGKTGIAIYYGAFQVIPFKPAAYVRGNNTLRHFPVEAFPTGNSWGALAFNTDIHSHKFRLEFFVDEIGAVLEEPLPSLVLLPVAGGTLA